MKKINLFIAIAMAVCLSSCSDDSCDHKTSGENSDQALSLAGSWYNEELCEEDTYSESGTFYMRYAIIKRCGQAKGTWELDSKNMRLTWTYPFMGRMMFNDWKVKNFKELGFTIASDKNGTHEYGKIVETYTLNVGETAAIQFSANYPDYTVYSYTSKNERIASVSADGLIKAEGEKGTTYIKVATSDGDAWVKVIVGDNCADLWYDYVSIIGMDYTGMANTLRELGSPESGSDGYSFRYWLQLHDMIDCLNVFLCPEDGLVTDMQLVLKDGVPEVEVLSYMNSRYYKQSESDAYVIFSTLKDLQASKAVVAYDKTKNMVLMLETQHFLGLHETVTTTDVFGTYWEDLGLTRDQLTAKYGAPYQEEDGMMYYVVGTDYVNLACFKIDATSQKCTHSLITINESVDTSTVVDYYNSKFNKYANGTAADGSQYAWIDGATVAESAVGVVYYPNDRMVVYQPLGAAASAKAARSMAVGANSYRQVAGRAEACLNRVRKTAEELKARKTISLQRLMRMARK